MHLTPIRIPGKNRKDKIKIGYDTRKSLVNLFEYLLDKADSRSPRRAN
jgi:hypothetical protein